MQVVRVEEFGGPEVLKPGTAPDQVPGPDDVVVAVRACDVMFLDTLLRSGWGAGFFPVRPPYVPGSGVAGQGRRPPGRRGHEEDRRREGVSRSAATRRTRSSRRAR